MGKTAFVFPGQGSQYTGMGKDFYQEFPRAREIYEIAETAAGIDVRSICFEPDERLQRTEYTQLAMLATEVAILEVLKQSGISADVCGGLSLGEYGALAAAECMTYTDLFWVVRQRGICMQNAYPEGGAMSAVLGMENKVIEDICAEVCKKSGKVVEIANYNCPGQTVITGEADAVALASEKLTAMGARRCIPLRVSGPFHSRLLDEAGRKLGEVLERVNVVKPVIPYIANVNAQYVTQADGIKNLLTKQICAPVQWQQSVERMAEDGVDTFIEIGPGKTLSGFIKKIDRELQVYNVSAIEDLKKLTEEKAC